MDSLLAAAEALPEGEPEGLAGAEGTSQLAVAHRLPLPVTLRVFAGEGLRVGLLLLQAEEERHTLTEAVGVGERQEEAVRHRVAVGEGEGGSVPTVALAEREWLVEGERERETVGEEDRHLLVVAEGVLTGVLLRVWVWAPLGHLVTDGERLIEGLTD